MTEETLFQEAISLSVREREAFLTHACAGQPELRAAVEALLAAHEQSGNALDQPPADPGVTMVPALHEAQRGDEMPGETARPPLRVGWCART